MIIESEVQFNEIVSTQLANELIVMIDKLITSKKLTYTQKITIENMREQGIFNGIMLGNFKNISVQHLIELFSVFNLGLRIATVDKELYEAEKHNTLTKH